MYRVKFDDEPINFINKLSKDLKKRIFNKILSTKTNPFHFFDKLEDRKDFKLRVGDYRVIADINQSSKTIEITRIGHRKNIYKQVK